MTIASLRFHWLSESRADAAEKNKQFGAGAVRHLWAYTLMMESGFFNCARAERVLGWRRED
jgi:hypothetical protein